MVYGQVIKDEAYMGEGLLWLSDADNQDAVERLCKRCCRGRKDLIDDMYCELVGRVDAVHANWDEALGATLRSHMLRCLGWYAFKWINRYEYRARREVSCAEIPEGSYSPPDPAHRDQVQYLVERLDDFDKGLLVMRHVEDLTFREIGETMGVSKNTARGLYHEALNRAREAAEEL